jgi:methyltransferase (TIGR00027 family)
VVFELPAADSLEPLAPSSSALAAAVSRAAHLIYEDEPKIFTDYLALPLAGQGGLDLLMEFIQYGPPSSWSLARSLHATRARFVEDHLEAARARGVGQYVALGAGLDSFAYRRARRLDGLRVFEVDEPEMQAWKRRRLTQLLLPEPDGLSFVPVDFRQDTLTEKLVDAGFDPAQPAIVSWLGVTPYLAEEAIATTLSELARLAPGTDVILTYIARTIENEEDRAVAESGRAIAASRGEPWLSEFDPDEIETLLRGCGFLIVSHFGPDQAARYFVGRTDGFRAQATEPLVIATVGSKPT